MSNLPRDIVRAGALCAALLTGLGCAAAPVSAQERVRWNTAIVEQEESAFASPRMHAVADSVVLHQSPEGGWPKNTDLAAPPDRPGRSVRADP